MPALERPFPGRRKLRGMSDTRIHSDVGQFNEFRMLDRIYATYLSPKFS